ncbi:STAGA complex 65 subunit gamma-like [Ceratina calcarata]|uniref:STAGA complex 65 subunit gamma-like n=1 Tax=Ceratina calcarata TaxID=156304 RepID=A0AAJ7S3Z1_9HYME|nr:STAGA complex 65 subunit gamma-like [Ceratina calcarata]
MKSTKNIGMGSLWGELPARETLKQEVITPDIIENVWRQVMEESISPDTDLLMDKQSDHIHFRSTFKGASTVHYLTTETARCILRRTVIILLAHIGFEKSSDIAIETLTDIADHFLRRIALLMKGAYEQKNHGFPDIVERVLLETGVGGIATLHDYYQEYVLKFEENMKRKVETMMEKQRMVLDEAANKLQFEELDEFGNVYQEVPTLQLLDPEMGFPPSLDAGFQMLYSLEQDELNNLEVEEEEVNVSDSPSTGQRLDTSSDKKKS